MQGCRHVMTQHRNSVEKRPLKNSWAYRSMTELDGPTARILQSCSDDPGEPCIQNHVFSGESHGMAGVTRIGHRRAFNRGDEQLDSNRSHTGKLAHWEPDRRGSSGSAGMPGEGRSPPFSRSRAASLGKTNCAPPELRRRSFDFRLSLDCLLARAPKTKTKNTI